jgi:hypothetical protein
MKFDMIISHKHKFIFVKTGKTAGTSVEIFLSQHCGDTDVVTPICPPVPSHFARNYRGCFNPLPELIAGQGLRRTRQDFVARRSYYNHLAARIIRARVGRRVWNSLTEVCQMLGIPFSGELDLRAKDGIREDRRPCREVFTEEQCRFVEKAFAVEIAMHGYQFPAGDPDRESANCTDSTKR